MATINKTPSGTFKVLIRKVGLPPLIKTFKNKVNAERWARFIESEIDRGVFVNRQEADRITVGELSSLGKPWTSLRGEDLFRLSSGGRSAIRYKKPKPVH